MGRFNSKQTEPKIMNHAFWEFMGKITKIMLEDLKDKHFAIWGMNDHQGVFLGSVCPQFSGSNMCGLTCDCTCHRNTCPLVYVANKCDALKSTIEICSELKSYCKNE